MHFCADELMAIVAAMPFVGYAFRWVKSKLGW